MSDIVSFTESAVESAVESDFEKPAPLPAPTPAPETVPVAAKPSRLMTLLPLATTGLAVFASLLSVIGLLVASRTVAAANQAIAELRAQPPAAGAPAPKSVEVAYHALHAESAKVASSAPQPVAHPATVEDVRRALDDLRGDLSRYSGDGGGLMVSTVRNGQAELANRISEMSIKVDRIDRALSSSRAAKPEAGRARPS